MSASASRVKQFAVAACAYWARPSERTRACYEQSRTGVLEFIHDSTAFALAGEIVAQAQVLPLVEGGTFELAVDRLDCTTRRLITHLERTPR
jgi:hypothetical protein